MDILTQRAENLYQECIDLLNENITRATQSEYYNSIAYDISNSFGDYCEVVKIDGRWNFVEYKTHNLISINGVNLYDVCNIVDNIINSFEFLAK